MPKMSREPAPRAVREASCDTRGASVVVAARAAAETRLHLLKFKTAPSRLHLFVRLKVQDLNPRLEHNYAEEANFN